MPRRALTITQRYPYHITARSNNKDWFYLPLEECWEIFCEKMVTNSLLFGTCFHAFVLMSNHIHAILSTPQANLGEVMRHLLTEVSKSISKKANRINHIFGSRYKWSVLDNAYSAGYVYKYVFRNPVRAGVCGQVEQYQFSSLTPHALLPNPPIIEGIDSLWSVIPRDYAQRLQWLNKPTPQELEHAITFGLRRETFQFSRANDTQSVVRALRQSYEVEPGYPL